MKTNIFSIASTTVGLANLGINTASNLLLRNEAKRNTKALIGIYTTLTLLAVGVSAVHTKNIVEAIRKEAYEGPNK